PRLAVETGKDPCGVTVADPRDGPSRARHQASRPQSGYGVAGSARTHRCWSHKIRMPKATSDGPSAAVQNHGISAVKSITNITTPKTMPPQARSRISGP